MQLTRTNFGQLLQPGQSKIFFDSYNEFAPQYTDVFRLEKSTKKEEKVTRLGSFGLWQENTEGNPINEDAITQGSTITFVNKRFDKGYEISWEMVQDDQYGIWKGNAGRGGNARSLGRSLRATVETEAAKILSGGFANVGYDGKPLFSEQHPLIDGGAQTGSNLIKGALTDANLKAACTMLRRQKDEAGAAPIAAVPEKVIVHPNYEFTAKAILNSTQVAGGSLNDANTLPNLDVVVLDYISDEDNWFVQARGIDNLTFFWREQPIFGAQPMEKTVDWFYYGYARWSCGYVDWRGIVGSAGA